MGQRTRKKDGNRVPYVKHDDCQKTMKMLYYYLNICYQCIGGVTSPLNTRYTHEYDGVDCMISEYNGGLTREQFLFYEIRTVASLLTQGISREEILNKLKEENLFQFPTERMVSSIATTCFKRIDALESDTLVYHLANAPAEVAKQINLYAMMKYNRIVWDFMTTVIAEKFRTQEFEFSRKDLNVFFFRLQEQNDSVASWSDSTINKIKQVLTRTLVECEYLDSVRATQLNIVSIAPELEDEIRASNDISALAAFNCFR